MSLAEYVRILGRGPGRSRSLSFGEASAAMDLMLKGAAPEAVGALLMLLRMKGENAHEIAGFAAAAKASLPDLPRPDLDWPSYAAGRTRGLPWFLLSARLVARAGHSVLLHGVNGTVPTVRNGIAELGIAPTELGATHMPRGNIAYLPLETLSPDLHRLLGLRATLGLRSCINTVCRMLDPGGARVSVAGVFHPSYRELQTQAAQILGWQDLSIVKGGGGEFERLPTKDIALHGLRGGQPHRADAPAIWPETRRLNDGTTDIARLSALWAGDIGDPFAEAIVTGTAALALDTLGEERAQDLAGHLWSTRHRARAA